MRSDETATSSERRSQDDGFYVEVALDHVQCPECGDRAHITKTDAHGKAQPVPADYSGNCGECGHRDHPLAFHHEYKWEELTDEERIQAKEARSRYEARMVEYHYSAHGIASRREL